MFLKPKRRPHWRLLGRLPMLLVIAASSLTATLANAAITCSISPPTAVNIAYVANTDNTSPANVQQGSVSATCTRTAASDPTDLSLAVNDGLYNNGSNNNAQLSSGGTNYRIRYDFFRDSACRSTWASSSNSRINATISNLTLNVPVTTTFAYWACKPRSESISSYPTGLYTDRADLTLTAGSSTVATSFINVNIYAPAVCSISHGPGQVTFSYSAFSAAAAFAGTSFRANCTNYLPYTMALDPVSGVVGGLRYTLGLSLDAAGNASNTGPTSLATQGNATGTATHYINGSMQANQAGQSGTIVPQTHTLTITY